MEASDTGVGVAGGDDGRPTICDKSEFCEQVGAKAKEADVEATEAERQGVT